MSASEATVATGEPFAQAYVHAGMVALDGEKMSKSKGNLELVSRLREEGHDPMAIRLALLAHHYRADWEWTDAELATAEQRIETWRTAVARTVTPPADDVVAEIREALADDLDAPAALAAIDAWAVAEGDDEMAGQDVARAIDALLGVSL
jgi:L-cysteine:1D-myo-inositol 2-amino-2-deoxy-alpha-D-glucopyranoside ligase